MQDSRGRAPCDKRERQTFLKRVVAGVGRHGLFFTLGLAFTTALLIGLKPWEARGVGSSRVCRAADRDELVCQSMHLLRRQVLLLQAQRDLMVVNYKWLEQVAEEIHSVLDSLIENRRKYLLGAEESDQGGSHPPLPVSTLEDIRDKSRELREIAGAKRFNALGIANNLHKECFSCHSKSSPASGHSWGDIFKFGWSYVVKECNKPVRASRIPYRCKSMHGMLSVLDYLGASVLLEDSYRRVGESEELRQPWVPNYHTISGAGLELQRIADDLVAKHAIVVGEQTEHLEEVQTLAAEIQDLAGQLIADDNNHLARQRLRDTIQGGTTACMKCHGD